MCSPVRSLAAFVSGLSVAFALPVIAQRTAPFPDVRGTEYYADAVGELATHGVIRGYHDGHFGPNDPVTRGQAAVLFQRYDHNVIDPMRLQMAEVRDKLGLSVCGNGEREQGEICDDGNVHSGDGCSFLCQQENPCPPGHRIGDRFPAPDGCNTCVCTETGVACTEIACIPPPGQGGVPSGPGGGGESAVEPKMCLSSEDCLSGERCSVDRGDCRSPCPPDAEACIQVCAGICEPASVPGGSTGGPVGSLCGNGVCDASESNHLTANPHVDYCPEDCSSDGPIGSAQSSTASCAREERDFQTAVETNSSCRTDADCVIVEASCPFVTCGVGVSRPGEAEVASAAESLARCRERSGTVACAGCVQVHAACVQGRCQVRETR